MLLVWKFRKYRKKSFALKFCCLVTKKVLDQKKKEKEFVSYFSSRQVSSAVRKDACGRAVRILIRSRLEVAHLVGVDVHA